MLATHLRHPIAFKQSGSERLPVDVDPSQHKAEKNFNFNNVRVVKILGGGLEGSMVVRGMAFGRDSDSGGCVFVLSPALPTTSNSFTRLIGEQA